MGRIALTGGGGFAASNNTKGELHRDTSFDDVARVLHRLSGALSLAHDRVCYVFGMGAQPKKKYDSLRHVPGVEVMFARSVLPRFARFLSPVVASYEGLIKIHDPSRLPDTFLGLMERSMVGVYCITSQLEQGFIAAVQEQSRFRRYDFGVKADPAYSLYIVDADNNESETGMVEVISYGVTTPQELIPQ